MKRNFDVVIPTGKNILDSHYSLCYTIRSIISQTYQPQNIFVVENMHNIGVKDVMHTHFGEFVTVIDGTAKTPNISFARNLGASNGNSDIIIFLDDDVILGYNDYFARVLAIMENNDFCCGAKRFWTSPKWHNYLSLNFSTSHNLQILKAKSFLPESIERTTGNRNCSEYSYIGNFGAIKRSVFNEIDGFDETFEGWLYQDTDLMMRLCYQGYADEILAYTDMFCYHLGHPADKQHYRARNKNLYEQKQKALGIKFSNNNFFGRFDDDSVSVITPIL